MPGRDSTGPMGQGSKTGRALGFCNENDMAGSTIRAGRGNCRGMGRGFGLGRSFLRGRRFAWNSDNLLQRYSNSSSFSKEDEVRRLKLHIEELNITKEKIEKCLNELESPTL